MIAKAGVRAAACVLTFAVAPAAFGGPSAIRSLSTWSIAAMNPVTGDVGVAAASCVPDAHADALASLVPGIGVGVTQALWNLENRNRLHEALLNGLSAEEAIEHVADASVDDDVDVRQYGAVTLTTGRVHIASFTGASTPDWSGSESNPAMAVSVQGNTLVSEAVVRAALAAFLAGDPGKGDSLADRLMRGLEAGSEAGGDIRCNRDGLTSTAVTAFILVARGGDMPYAASTIRVTDQGTAAAPWLAISEASPLEGPNPIPAVRRRFDAWKAAQ